MLKEEERSQKIDDLPVLATCQADTLVIYSPAKLMVPFPIEALSSKAAEFWVNSEQLAGRLDQHAWG